MRAYFKWLANAIATNIGPNVRVLDIASNDGSFLDALRDEGLACKGIDPASNLTSEAAQKGHDVICDYFPSSQMSDKFDVITAMNVVAHNPDPVAFLKGVFDQLNDDGIALIQTSQALMLEAGEFDTIYHEHYSFFTKESLVHAANRAGLHLNAVELTDIHGTSSLFFLSKNQDRKVSFSDLAPFNTFIPATRIKEFTDADDIKATYNDFAVSAQNRMK